MGAILYGWNALSDEEKNDILDKLARGLEIGIELIRSVVIVGHPNQIVPIVRYWIPHIRIISPEALQTDLERELAEYLRR